MTASSKQPERFNRAMARQQKAVHASMDRASTDSSIVLLLTGDGKGKTTAGFGTVMRALGWGMHVAVVQFIKGTQPSGEEKLLREHFPAVPLIQMATGFTWDTQDHAADSAAARKTWDQAATLLQDPGMELILLDELTYMLAFNFLDESEVIDCIRQRPPHQHVVITGRGGGSALRSLADTVSDVRSHCHAYEAGIRAQQGLDY